MLPPFSTARLTHFVLFQCIPGLSERGVKIIVNNSWVHLDLLSIVSRQPYWFRNISWLLKFQHVTSCICAADVFCKLCVHVNFREKSTEDSKEQIFIILLVILHLMLGCNGNRPVIWAGVSRGQTRVSFTGLWGLPVDFGAPDKRKWAVVICHP